MTLKNIFSTFVSRLQASLVQWARNREDKFRVRSDLESRKTKYMHIPCNDTSVSIESSLQLPVCYSTTTYTQHLRSIHPTSLVNAQARRQLKSSAPVATNIATLRSFAMLCAKSKQILPVIRIPAPGYQKSFANIIQLQTLRPRNNSRHLRPLGWALLHCFSDHHLV